MIIPEVWDIQHLQEKQEEDNKQTMLNAISEYENLDTSIKLDGVEMAHCESGTNIEAGLKRANDNFTKECKNKILVLLTDGIPNASINYSSSTYVYSATKTRLKSIGDSGVSVISLMTGVTSKDEEGVSSDPMKIVEQIFGTTTNSTTGIFYNIKDANLESVVTIDIYADVMEKVQLSEVKDELSATVNYDPTTSTTGKVMATIKTNKKVNQIDGWTISEDGMTLTKYYSYKDVK